MKNSSVLYKNTNQLSSIINNKKNKNKKYLKLTTFLNIHLHIY